MRTLVIDTATPHLSVALFDDGVLIGHHHQAVGRGHAELLLPVIAALPDGGRADALRIGCGPGSFTGQRIGIAAARALAFAWGADLLGFNTLALIAAQGRRLSGAASVAVVQDGGHGDWTLADALVSDAGVRSLTVPPEEAVALVTADIVVGQRAADLVALRGWGTAVMADADARDFAALGPHELFADTRPLYARAPDAKVAVPKVAMAQ